MKYLNLFFSGALVVIILFGCKSNRTKNDASDIAIEPEMTNTTEKAVKKVFFNMPSPIELTQTVLSSKQPFNLELLNSVENIENYSSSASLAMNFGVYGADLCYCRVYDQLQESISYLAVIRKLSDKLQIPEESGSETINRIEESLENRDSIFQIISDTYAEADGYLKENERDATAAFILLGGWIEGMHFATNIAISSSNDKQIMQRLAEQKYSLDNIISIVTPYQETPAIAKILPILLDMQELYKNVSFTYEKPVVVTDNEDKVTTIDNKAEIKISSEQINEIARLVAEIRTIIIS